jgi:5-methylcytosine-specific restriction endonuclease McrA
MKQRVLVLNRAWQPVNIVGMRRAINLLFQEHAQVIHADASGHRVMPLAEWLAFSEKHPDPANSIRAVRLAVLAPSVLLLTEYDRLPRREVRFSRRNVYLRDAHRCQYCGRVFEVAELTLDHVVPREKGGKTNWENIVTACSRCNAKKANRLPNLAGMVLRKLPARPKWRAFLTAFAGEEEAAPWLPFIGAPPKDRARADSPQ